MKTKLQKLCETCGGKCCRCFNAIILNPEEDARKFEMLGADIVDDRAFGLLIKMPNGKCQFLSDKNRCTIYDDRPWACMEFDCTDPRRHDSAVFDDFPEHRRAVEEAK